MEAVWSFRVNKRHLSCQHEDSRLAQRRHLGSHMVLSLDVARLALVLAFATCLLLDGWPWLLNRRIF